MSIPYFIEKDHGMRPSPMTRAYTRRRSRRATAPVVVLDLTSGGLMAHRMRRAQKERRSTLRAVAVGLVLLVLAGIGIWLLIRGGR